MNHAKRTIGILAAIGLLAGCGGAPVMPEELVQLEALTSSEDHMWWVRSVEQAESDDHIVEARELVELADLYHEMSRDALDDDAERSARFATVSRVYFEAAAAEMEASAIDADRQQLEAELEATHAEVTLRREFIATEEELMAALGALQRIYAENTALQQESAAGAAIQEARVEQRTASGMFAEEFAAEPFGQGTERLEAAVASFDAGAFLEAEASAVEALTLFQEAGRIAEPRFQEVESELLRNESTRRLMERAEAEFGDAVRLEARGVVIMVTDLFEGTDPDPRVADRWRLSALVPILLDYPTYAIVVEGHTDDRGSSTSNRTLGQSRANAVRGFFIANGVAAQRVTATSAGEEAPAFDNHTSEGRRLNRRVEVVLQIPQ